MPLPGNRYAAVGDLFVALADDILLHVGMLRTLHKIAPAGDMASAVSHRVGRGDYFAAWSVVPLTSVWSIIGTFHAFR